MLRKEFRLAVKFVGIHFFIFLLLKMCSYGHKIKGKCLCKYFPFFVI